MFRLIELIITFPFKIITLPFKILSILFSTVYNFIGKLILIGLVIIGFIAVPPISSIVTIIVCLYLRSNKSLEG